MRLASFLVMFAMALAAQDPGTDPVYEVKGPIRPPTVVRSAHPEYSAEAKSALVQGTVMLSAVVDRQGKATLIEVVSPLGFGLDESAEEALAKWEFAPAKKDGLPVRAFVGVEVNFRLQDSWFDAKVEKQRTEYSSSLGNLDSAPYVSVESIRKLAEQKYPPAIYMTGRWLEEGKYGEKKPAEALALFQKAAEKNYGPALYEIGYRQIEGRELALDVEKGLATMRQSALLGSAAAQLYLGQRYESMPLELDRAQRYFRLCAAQGEPLCRYRLGSLLLKSPRHYLQALAWLQLASEGDLALARELAAQEDSKLTAVQRGEVDSLRRQLTRK